MYYGRSVVLCDSGTTKTCTKREEGRHAYLSKWGGPRGGGVLMPSLVGLPGSFKGAMNGATDNTNFES